MSEERACVAARSHLHGKHVKLERYPPSPMISPGRARPRQLVVHQGFSTHGSLLAVAVMAARRQACSRTQFMQSVMQFVILMSLSLSAEASNLRSVASTNPAHHPTGESTWVKYVLMFIPALAILSIFGCMQPFAGRARGAPPRWSMENSHSYSYDSWVRDLQLWAVVNQDLSQAQQCALIIQHLDGAAKDLLGSMTAHQMTQGGLINGQQVDPLTFILAQVAMHYGPLGEEQRLQK